MKTTVKKEQAKTPEPPTLEQFARYQSAWGYFNQVLFNGELNPCLLNFSRHRGAMGFFHAEKWRKHEEQAHEISLNPDALGRPLDESMATLVHEMCHQWQYDHGSPSRGGYHNAQWGNKMIELGLVPSSTGKPGGSPTGQKMTHYIQQGGLFEKALNKMPAEYILPWLSEGPLENAKPKSKKPKKIKLKCPECQKTYCWTDNADFEILCGDCGEEMLSGEAYREAVREKKDN